MMIITAIIAISILSVFIIYEIVHYIWFVESSITRQWDSGRVQRTMYLSWRELRDFYAVNPEKWEYSKTGALQDLKHLYYMNSHDIYTAVTLSFPSFMRLLWHYHFKHKKYAPAKTAFLLDVQKDIDELKRKAQAEIDQANKAMEQINSRVKEGMK